MTLWVVRNMNPARQLFGIELGYVETKTEPLNTLGGRGASAEEWLEQKPQLISWNPKPFIAHLDLCAFALDLELDIDTAARRAVFDRVANKIQENVIDFDLVGPEKRS